MKTRAKYKATRANWGKSDMKYERIVNDSRNIVNYLWIRSFFSSDLQVNQLNSRVF